MGEWPKPPRSRSLSLSLFIKNSCLEEIASWPWSSKSGIHAATNRPSIRAMHKAESWQKLPSTDEIPMSSEWRNLFTVQSPDRCRISWTQYKTSPPACNHVALLPSAWTECASKTSRRRGLSELPKWEKKLPGRGLGGDRAINEDAAGEGEGRVRRKRKGD